MESQSQTLIHPHDDNQAQEHEIAGDQHQEGGEKKSVMKKMKDRAKKIRETIKNYGQHGNDNESDEMKTPPDNHDLVEEDTDSDEEILEDSAVHGPPMYESGAGTGAQRSQPEELSRPQNADEQAFVGGEGKGKGGDLGRTGQLLENTAVPSSHRQEVTFAPAPESPENTDRTSNYQSKVTDSAVHSRPEIHGTPMYDSGAGTGAQTRQPGVLSRPQNADEQAFVGGGGKGKGGDSGRTGQLLENTAVPSSHRQEVTFAPAPESPEQRKVHPEIPRGMEEDPADQTSNYQSKVTDSTGRGEEVRDITPMIQSFGKLGMRDEQNRGEKQSTSAGELPGSHQPEPATVPEQVVENSESERQSPMQGGYMSAIASTAASLGTNLMSRVVRSGTATETETNVQESGGVEPEPKQSSVVEEKMGPVYEKGGGAGTAVLSKVVNQETMEVDSGSGEDKGMSMSSYLSELPGSHQPEPATVPEQVVENSESERQSPMQGGYMSAIASTAASLGTNLMSRVVGSGTATEAETITGMDNLQESEGGKPKQSSVAEKIGPAEEKAAGAGTGKQTSQETMELDSGVGGAHENSGEGKGVSAGSYLSEKLKPGEEDEALSEVISEKLRMKKREETHEHGEEGSDDLVKGGNGMVDKLRGAVGSWFSKPGQPRDSVTSDDAAEQLGEEEKQPQKPGN